MPSVAGFWEYPARLKMVDRKGWTKIGSRKVESVADHSFALALICLFESERRGYDTGRVLKLALIHDLEESITGDLTPADKRVRGKMEVKREKNDAIRKLIRMLPFRSRSEYRELWKDLHVQRSKEARLVHQLDKFEMALQARRYSKEVGRRRVTDFYSSAAEEITDISLTRELRKITGRVRSGS